MMGVSAIRESRRITGRTVLFGLIAFFALVTAVNGVFIYFAMTSWPGLASRDAYKEGLNYNAVIDDAQRQDALGWTSDLRMDRSGVLTLRILDGAGASVNGLRIAASLARPVGDERRLAVDLMQALDGSYRGFVALPAAGQWRVQIVAQRDGDTRYRMSYDITVRP